MATKKKRTRVKTSTKQKTKNTNKKIQSASKPKATPKMHKTPQQPKTAPVVPPALPESGRHQRNPFAWAAASTVFRRAFAVFSVLVLLTTSLLWALLGARLQDHNADQLSDPYLFSSWKTFHGASFPGSHTFLLKWPIFWLINVFGVTTRNLDIATVGVVLITVATLAFVLYKIDRRPLIFGTICLGISLALLLVPAQPYAGALLPVNMAMLTTRNIEYSAYLATLVLFARAKRTRSWSLLGGVVILAVLIASDKLFLSLSLGGALIALAIYAPLRARRYVTFALRWAAGTVCAAALAYALLAIISASHLTHLVNGGSATPYGTVSSLQNLLLGVLYGILGIFTNAGANPVYDNLVIRKLPSELEHRLMSFSDPAYVAAAIALLYALLLAWRLVWREPRKAPRATPSGASLLALALIWSSVAACGVFVLSNHYYEVDARYLAVGFFALVVTTSVELRKRHWQHPESLLYVACGLLAAIAIAVGTSVDVTHTQNGARSGLDQRNSAIAGALKNHRVDVLVGSYWRVLPVKLAMQGHITAMPLSGCTEPYNILSSSAWQPNLATHSFAYLLTLSGNSVAGFPDCSVNTITNAYGRPNATQVIAGTVAKPTEVLLFYDRGSKPKVTARESASPTSVLPISMADLSSANNCTTPTVMNVVAHEDDDILFMNPDLMHEVKAGDCIRTVYLTAGNAGQGKLYWLSRQLGEEAAYDKMLGNKAVWEQQTVEIARREYVTVASPRGDAKDTLIFFNIPDGDLFGEGYPMSNYESLQKLERGEITSIRTVDGQSTYTKKQLTTALTQLMQLYRPSVIQSMANVPGGRFPDHSDHIATGQFTQAAATAYDHQEFGNVATIPLKLYVGYPVHGYPANVTGDDLQRKENIFMAYAAYDDSVCHTIAQCEATPTYNAYLTRQYLDTTPVPQVAQ